MYYLGDRISPKSFTFKFFYFPFKWHQCLGHLSLLVLLAASTICRLECESCEFG